MDACNAGFERNDNIGPVATGQESAVAPHESVVGQLIDVHLHKRTRLRSLQTKIQRRDSILPEIHIAEAYPASGKCGGGDTAFRRIFGKLCELYIVEILWL